MLELREPMAGVIRKYVSDADVEDVVQEAVIQVLRGIDSLREESKVRPWARKVALNCVRNFHRHRSRKAHMRDIKDIYYPEQVDYERLCETRSQIKHLCGYLSKDEFQIVALYYFYDMSVAEIMENTTSSKEAIRVRLHRARNKLRMLALSKSNNSDVRNN